MAIKIKSATGIGLVGSMGGRPWEQEVEIIADTEAEITALWEGIAYREGHRIIPAVITAGTAFAKITAGTAFAKGEFGWWGDVLYRSLIDANVYTPEQYPAGWEAV